MASKYSELCAEMDRHGGYMSNAIGMCQRELIAVSQKRKSRSDLFLTGSATYAAFQRGVDLSRQFKEERAQHAALVWTHDLKTGRMSPPFPVSVDWESAVVRQENTKVYGLLSDVRHCLVQRDASGNWRPCSASGQRGQVVAAAEAVKDFDRFTTTKPKTGGKGLARIGQAWYREKVMEIWEGRCAVTGCDQPELLRASHIVAWSGATGKERLDPENGLLLVAHLDAAFDKGLVSFAQDGSILISASLSQTSRAALRIHAGMRLSKVSPATEAYLARHRQRYNFVQITS